MGQRDTRRARAMGHGARLPWALGLALALEQDARSSLPPSGCVISDELMRLAEP